MDVLTPMVVHISVYSGHMTEGFSKQSPLATVFTERWYMAPGVCRIDIREHGVRGTLFLPPGPGPFPGVLDMWGGGGGLVEYRSCLLASQGFVSMALEYLSHDKNRTSDIDFKTYFEVILILCVCLQGCACLNVQKWPWEGIVLLWPFTQTHCYITSLHIILHHIASATLDPTLYPYHLNLSSISLVM